MAAAATKTRKGHELSAQEARVKALSEPIREQLLRHWIEKGVTSPVEASHALRIPLTRTSYHVRRLRDLGFLEEVRTEPVRGSTKHYLRATERALIDEPEWKELSPFERDSSVGASMQSLIGDFSKAAKEGEFQQPEGDFWIARIPVKSMDEEGYRELLDAQRRLFEETFEIEMRAAERMAESGEKGTKVSVGNTCWRISSF
jgi:hypothetical protein